MKVQTGKRRNDNDDICQAHGLSNSGDIVLINISYVVQRRHVPPPILASNNWC